MPPERSLIANARIVDGSGRPAFPGSIVIDGGRIAEIHPDGAPVPDAAMPVIDASGRVLAPGFVDVHTHSDLVPFVEPWMDSALRQGVTTAIVGNCGSSPWPAAGAAELATLIGVEPGEIDADWRSFGGWLDRVAACRPGINIGALVGHGAVRREILGAARRAPNPEELARMADSVEEATRDGAFGLSSGLVYVPGMYAATDELVALARASASSGGVYASHIRGEGAQLFRAVAEAIEIGRRATAPVHLSHLKLEGRHVWGRADALLGALAAARGRGQDVSGDQYPYAAWASELSSLLPPWVRAGTLAQLSADADTLARLRTAVEHGEGDWQSSVDGVGWDRIVIESHRPDPNVRGRSIAEVAGERRIEPVRLLLDLLRADPDTGAIGHAMREDDVRAVCADPTVMVASDSSATSPEGPLRDVPVHPRTYGTFPRAIGDYVRDGVLDLESAVRKSTALPAERLGLSRKGKIAAGADADLVLFDPGRLRDTSTSDRPHTFPEGVHAVIVAGRVAWTEATGRGERAGTVLRRGQP